MIVTVPRTQYTAAPIVHSAPSSAMSTGPLPSHGLLSCSPAPEQTQSIIHPRDTQSSFSILQNTMQFYLLLALSGVISGNAVLAQGAIGYAAPQCSGLTTFTYTPSTLPTCSDITSPGTKSVNLPQGVLCVLYESPGCAGSAQNLDNPSCIAVELSRVGSYSCIADQDGDGSSNDSAN